MYLIFQTVGIVIILQCCLYALYLLGRKEAANKFLLAYLVIIILTLANIFLRDQLGIPYFYNESLVLLGPVFLGYVRALTGIQHPLDKRWWWALGPFGGLLAFHLLFPVLYEEVENALTIAVLAYSYVFVGMSVHYLRSYHKMLLNASSNYTAFNLKWLNYEIVAIVVFFIGLGGEQLLDGTSDDPLYLLVVLITFLSMLMFINLLTYKSLKAPFTPMPGRQQYYEKYTSSSVTQPESSAHYQQLLTLMESQKPFRNGELNLQELADQMDLTKAALSQVINQNARQNFNDFINSFRVKEGKELLLDRELLIKEVMYRSGFNSTSTFNAVFTKHTGLSPSKYRKKHGKGA